LTETPEENRVWKLAHDSGVAHLETGSSVNSLTLKFIDELIQQFDKEPLGQRSSKRLGEFFKTSMFRASMASLVGSEIFNLNPQIEEIYCKFEGSFFLMALGLPKFLYYKGHAARDRMLNASKKWISAAWKISTERTQMMTGRGILVPPSYEIKLSRLQRLGSARMDKLPLCYL
jgi:hypothetical protein